MAKEKMSELPKGFVGHGLAYSAGVWVIDLVQVHRAAADLGGVAGRTMRGLRAADRSAVQAVPAVRVFRGGEGDGEKREVSGGEVG